MEYHLMIVSIFVCILSHVFGGELTFELPDNERQCFFEQIEKGVKSTLEFQVITGGQYDVDMELTSPSGQVLYKDVKKQYDTFTWTSDHSGVYKFCFSNEFSTFSHKVVYFDFQVGEEKPLVEGDNQQHATAMTMMETMSFGIHEALSDVSDQQTYFKNREASGRLFAESLNERVMFWSIGESIIVLLVGIGQVFILRSFFQDKKSTGGVPITS